MTDRAPVSGGAAHFGGRPRKRRLPKGVLRTLAWIGGGLSFMAPVAVLGMAPKPTSAATTPTSPAPVAPRTVIVHRIVRKVIVQEPSTQPGGTTVISGGSSGGGVIYIPAPAAPATISTGGSGHP